MASVVQNVGGSKKTTTTPTTNSNVLKTIANNASNYGNLAKNGVSAIGKAAAAAASIKGKAADTISQQNAEKAQTNWANNMKAKYYGASNTSSANDNTGNYTSSTDWANQMKAKYYGSTNGNKVDIDGTTPKKDDGDNNNNNNGGGSITDSVPDTSSADAYASYIAEYKAMVKDYQNQLDKLAEENYKLQVQQNEKNALDQRNQANLNSKMTEKWLNQQYGNEVSGAGISNRLRNRTALGNTIAEINNNLFNNNSTASLNRYNTISNNAKDALSKYQTIDDSYLSYLKKIAL